jgi:hypothetical protein
MSSGRLNDIAMKLRQDNRALSLRQLGAAYGLGYVRIKQMQALPRFPLIAGKVIPSDFDRWRLMQTGLSSLHRADRPRSAVGKVHELTSRSDSRVSWRQIGCNLRAAIESHESREGNENNVF